MEKSYATMLRWRLNAVMADNFIGTGELARQMDKPPKTISNLKNREDVPRLNGEQLANLCDSMNKILVNRGKNPCVTIHDLFDYRFDDAA